MNHGREVTVASAFPYHPQRTDASCGIACLRMVEEFLTGSARSETKWRRELDTVWTDVGIRTNDLVRRVRALAKGRARPRTPRMASLEQLPKRWLRDSSALVMLIDSLSYAGPGKPALNDGHFIVVHDFVKAAAPWATATRRYAAVYHDPSEGPDQVWPWDSLLLTAHAAVLITKKPEGRGTTK